MTNYRLLRFYLRRHKTCKPACTNFLHVDGRISFRFFSAAFSHVMKGVEGFQNEGYTLMTLMRMTFGEFDVSWRQRIFLKMSVIINACQT